MEDVPAVRLNPTGSRQGVCERRGGTIGVMRTFPAVTRLRLPDGPAAARTRASAIVGSDTEIATTSSDGERNEYDFYIDCNDY